MQAAQNAIRTTICLTVLALILLPACNSGPGISMQKPTPLKSNIEEARSELVANRYLLLPASWSADKLMSPSSFGGYSLSGSSWVGLGFTKNYGRQWLNLHVVDLEQDRHDPVFERQVALGGWDDSFGERRELLFPGLLILVARAADTNADGYIDQSDEIHVFAYDLAARTRRQLSPAGYSTCEVKHGRSGLILLLQGAGDGVSVYEVDPRTGAGNLAARNVSP